MSTPEQPSPRQKMEQEERKTPDIIPMHHPIMREMAEPKDGFEPTPVWLMLIYFALIGWGGYYLAFNSGAFRSDVFTDGPRQTMGAGAPEQAAGGQQVDPMVLGRRIYNNCTTCHQADGQGVAEVYPPLAGSEWVNGPEQVLVRILLHGLGGPIEVQGKPYEGEMPAWGQLKDEQIAAVLTYVRASWGNSAPPVSAETVATIRAETSGRTAVWTEPELEQVAARTPAP